MKNICVFASGFGSNFQAIINAVKNKKIRKGKVTLLITDSKDCYARKRARKEGIEDLFVNPRDFNSKKQYEAELVKIIKSRKIDLIVLAGFMRILSPYFVGTFRNKILNIHPALLPSFRGAHGIKDAFKHGVKVTGVTIHFVDEKVDHGPVILQEAIPVKENETMDSLERRIHRIEHTLYPRAINLFLEGKLKVVKNNKVKVLK